MKIFRVLQVVVLLLLTACSYQFIYRHLDTLIPFYINNLVDLEELDERADKESIELLIWHQREQLPQYTDWLKQNQALIKNENSHVISARDIDKQLESLNGFWHQLRQKTSVDLARLLPLLNEQQINELFLSLEENSHDYIKKNISLSVAEKNQLYQQRLLEQFEHWLGYLSEEQKSILIKSVDGFQSQAALRLKSRLEWQQKTRQILLSNEDNKPTVLSALFTRLSIKYDQLYQPSSAKNRQHLSELIARILTTIDKQQRQNISDRFDQYIKMIDEFIQHQWK